MPWRLGSTPVANVDQATGDIDGYRRVERAEHALVREALEVAAAALHA